MENLTGHNHNQVRPADWLLPVPITGVNACNQTDPAASAGTTTRLHTMIWVGKLLLEAPCAGQG